MTKEELLKMCDLIEHGLTVNENNKHWYDKAIEMGYVEVKKPKRATKFFLTEAGTAAIQPVLYLYLYKRFYFIIDSQLTEEAYEAYHDLHPDLQGWDLLIQYHKDKINKWDKNETQKIPHTLIYNLAKQYEYSKRPEEAIRYYLLICILDLSGIMEIPTVSSMREMNDAYRPGGFLYKSKEDILKKATLYPGIVNDIRNTLGSHDLKQVYTDVYSSLSLPVQVRDREEILQEIEKGITEDNRG